MKQGRVYAILLGLLISTSVFCQQNSAVKIDGLDNRLSMGMDTLKDVWTLEAWIKADGDQWKDLETIIAGGEYGKQNISDHLPLVIKDGKLHNRGANISSLEILPTDKWLHIAATSDGKSTSLYINGNNVATRDTSISVLAGSIGADEKKESVFGGMIDEVRIWKAALSKEQLKDWMNRPINPSHPHFKKLHGYYTFDQLSADMFVNRVGRGHLPYHIRNGRLKHYGEEPLAYVLDNDNESFKPYTGEQRLFNATVIASEWDSDKGEVDEQILKIRIIVDGETDPLFLDKITLDLSKCSGLDDIKELNWYYTGSTPRSQVKEQITKPITKIKEKIVVRVNKGVKLAPGVNYFLLSADISSDAKVGNRIRVEVPSILLSGKMITPIPDESSLDKIVSINSTLDKDILKVIQWNIWHGGVHVGGKQGRLRIVDLIRESNADVVMMQEAYGSQKQIADSLGFQMISASYKDNLALFSRYPLKKISTKKVFNSNPAYLTMPSEKRILIDNIWIRYANPEYTCLYGSQGMDPEVWYKQDSLLGLMDIERNILNDINPHLEPEMDVILAGDFNSGSHLDWTERAAHLHYGYAAPWLPISRYLYERGYLDSFRVLNPNEVLRPEGTFAPVFGNLQTSRIDFIYYKGLGIIPIFSKIVRTPYEIDDVWASDHAAVMTTFRTSYLQIGQTN